jgi:hypothetical protein
MGTGNGGYPNMKTVENGGMNDHYPLTPGLPSWTAGVRLLQLDQEQVRFRVNIHVDQFATPSGYNLENVGPHGRVPHENLQHFAPVHLTKGLDHREHGERCNRFSKIESVVWFMFQRGSAPSVHLDSTRFGKFGAKC